MVLKKSEIDDICFETIRNCPYNNFITDQSPTRSAVLGGGCYEQTHRVLSALAENGVSARVLKTQTYDHVASLIFASDMQRLFYDPAFGMRETVDLSRMPFKMVMDDNNRGLNFEITGNTLQFAPIDNQYLQLNGLLPISFDLDQPNTVDLIKDRPAPSRFIMKRKLIAICQDDEVVKITKQFGNSTEPRPLKIQSRNSREIHLMRDNTSEVRRLLEKLGNKLEMTPEGLIQWVKTSIRFLDFK